MVNNKIFILLPDGVGLKNFAYTKFYSKAAARGFDVVFWNQTPFDLSTLGFREIKIAKAPTSPITDILKRARVRIDLDQNIRKSNDRVYDSYRFPYSYHNLKEIIKSSAVKTIGTLFSSTRGIAAIRRAIFTEERKLKHYKDCLEVLKKERPAVVFCTNQRTVSSIGPILAAKELGIPTATFIYSWDNLPKATLMIEPDFYFVWSDYMKKELLHYYSFINADQVVVTGTPQFETHTYDNNTDTREDFFAEYGLDINKKYICYSGDDITTSPNDPQYLRDTADAVRELNKKGHNLGIIFRRCPVDFSSRFDAVLNDNKDLIVPIPPKWDKIGDGWNTVLPTIADLNLQMNTIAHSEMVINLGSSMVFDYVSFNKPCAFINYDIAGGIEGWSVDKIYKYVHFRSMPSKNSVMWINNPESIESIIAGALANSEKTIGPARLWFETINQHPAKEASSRILDAFEKIINDAEKNIK